MGPRPNVTTRGAATGHTRQPELPYVGDCVTDLSPAQIKALNCRQRFIAKVAYPDRRGFVDPRRNE
jgi:hypothetical protein